MKATLHWAYNKTCSFQALLIKRKFKQDWVAFMSQPNFASQKKIQIHLIKESCNTFRFLDKS